MPAPFGPRNWGHCASSVTEAAAAASATASVARAARKTRRLFFRCSIGPRVYATRRCVGAQASLCSTHDQLAVRIERLYRAELLQHVGDLRRVANDDDLEP